MTTKFTNGNAWAAIWGMTCLVLTGIIYQQYVGRINVETEVVKQISAKIGKVLPADVMQTVEIKADKEREAIIALNIEIVKLQDQMSRILNEHETILKLEERIKLLHIELADRTRDRVYKSEIKPEALK